MLIRVRAACISAPPPPARPPAQVGAAESGRPHQSGAGPAPPGSGRRLARAPEQTGPRAQRAPARGRGRLAGGGPHARVAQQNNRIHLHARSTRGNVMKRGRASESEWRARAPNWIGARLHEGCARRALELEKCENARPLMPSVHSVQFVCNWQSEPTVCLVSPDLCVCVCVCLTVCLSASLQGPGRPRVSARSLAPGPLEPIVLF